MTNVDVFCGISPFRITVSLSNINIDLVTRISEYI